MEVPAAVATAAPFRKDDDQTLSCLILRLMHETTLMLGEDEWADRSTSSKYTRERNKYKLEPTRVSIKGEKR